MRLLVAIITCEKRRAWADAQRSAWVKDCRYDCRFFLARQERPPLPDEVFLECGDGYENLCEKVRAAHRWALLQGYGLELKVDDDVMLWQGRLVFPKGDYEGWRQEAVQGAPHCAGMIYWLSEKAMRIMSIAALPETHVNTPAAEDRWTGHTLAAAGIMAKAAPWRSIQWVGKGRPLARNWKALVASCYAAGEFLPHEFELVCRC